MIPKTFFLGPVLLSLLLVSCGKKVQETQKLKENSVSPSMEEMYFNALKEVKRAVNENDLETLKKLVLENPGIDLNQILSESGETFLTLAIKRDFRHIRNYLIEKGVALEKPNVFKETPLHVAVSNKMLNSLQILLDLKVDLERKNANGDTVLHIALKQGNDEMALILIRDGANIYALDAKDRNALKLAQEFQVKESLENIKSLMDMELGAPDIHGFKSLLLQADHKRLQLLLARYPKIATDKAYQAINPLALLVEVKDEARALKSAELLINHETNVNGPEGAELTPLIKATVAHKKGFADLYLSSKANPQLLDKDGKSALIHAIEQNNSELVDLLLSYSAVEKYTLRKGGKKITYSACEVANATEKKLVLPEDKKTNEKIRKSLDCGFFGWSF